MIDHSPKLKVAADEIRAILRKHDIAGFVFLHTPNIIEGVRGSEGAGEYMVCLNPSYSALEFMPDGSGVNIKGKLIHYGGDREKRDQQLRDTINMLRVLCEMAGPIVVNFMDVSEQAERVWDAEHGPSTHTPGNPQAN